MSRDNPQFSRMIDDLRRAEVLWDSGHKDSSRRILKVVASIAYASSVEPSPNTPLPEGISLPTDPDLMQKCIREFRDESVEKI